MKILVTILFLLISSSSVFGFVDYITLGNKYLKKRLINKIEELSSPTSTLKVNKYHGYYYKIHPYKILLTCFGDDNVCPKKIGKMRMILILHSQDMNEAEVLHYVFHKINRV